MAWKYVVELFVATALLTVGKLGINLFFSWWDSRGAKRI